MKNIFIFLSLFFLSDILTYPTYSKQNNENNSLIVVNDSLNHSVEINKKNNVKNNDQANLKKLLRAIRLPCGVEISDEGGMSWATLCYPLVCNGSYNLDGRLIVSCAGCSITGPCNANPHWWCQYESPCPH